MVRGWVWHWELGALVAFSHTSLSPGVPQHSRWAQAHLGTQHPPAILGCVLCPQGAAAAGRQSRAEQSQSSPIPGWHQPLGDTAVRCHTPRVDNIQMPARPGYESARTGAQQPLSSAGAKFPTGWRDGHRRHRLCCHLHTSPGHGEPLAWHSFPGSVSTMARWHRAKAVPNLDLPSWRAAGPARLSLRVPRHRHVPPGRPEHSCGESLSLTGYLKAHSCPLSPLMFRLEEPRALP